MKATDFLNDWYSGTHTSNPSIQDIIDWTERCHMKDNMDLKRDIKRDIIYEVKSQCLIEFACNELENIINTGGADIVNKFRKAMEEYMNYA